MDVKMKWKIIERVEALVCFLRWVRALKISHIQGHVSLTTMTTRVDDNFYTMLYFQTLLHIIHIQNCFSHYLYAMSSLHCPLPLNPPTPSHVKVSNPYPPQRASWTHSFILKSDIGIQWLPKSILAVN